MGAVGSVGLDVGSSYSLGVLLKLMDSCISLAKASSCAICCSFFSASRIFFCVCSTSSKSSSSLLLLWVSFGLFRVVTGSLTVNLLTRGLVTAPLRFPFFNKSLEEEDVVGFLKPPPGAVDSLPLELRGFFETRSLDAPGRELASLVVGVATVALLAEALDLAISSLCLATSICCFWSNSSKLLSNAFLESFVFAFPFAFKLFELLLFEASPL
mmetsp:Transcript_1559/g.2235  ORF Transcript_1559/g.2235 Transcript_1559/m.2235 type:complete len:213 (+) Transcript_1559:496-1134(+)